jgi:hypothetical protein
MNKNLFFYKPEDVSKFGMLREIFNNKHFNDSFLLVEMGNSRLKIPKRIAECRETPVLVTNNLPDPITGTQCINWIITHINTKQNATTNTQPMQQGSNSQPPQHDPFSRTMQGQQRPQQPPTQPQFDRGGGSNDPHDPMNRLQNKGNGEDVKDTSGIQGIALDGKNDSFAFVEDVNEQQLSNLPKDEESSRNFGYADASIKLGNFNNMRQFSFLDEKNDFDTQGGGGGGGGGGNNKDSAKNDEAQLRMQKLQTDRNSLFSGGKPPMNPMLFNR